MADKTWGLPCILHAKERACSASASALYLLSSTSCLLQGVVPHLHQQQRSKILQHQSCQIQLPPLQPPSDLQGVSSDSGEVIEATPTAAQEASSPSADRAGGAGVPPAASLGGKPPKIAGRPTASAPSTSRKGKQPAGQPGPDGQDGIIVVEGEMGLRQSQDMGLRDLHDPIEGDSALVIPPCWLGWLATGLHLVPACQ